MSNYLPSTNPLGDTDLVCVRQNGHLVHMTAAQAKTYFGGATPSSGGSGGTLANDRIIAGPSLTDAAAPSNTATTCNTAQPIIFRGGATRFKTEYDGRYFPAINTAVETDLPADVTFSAAFMYPYACFTGSISGTTLTVTAATLGQIAVGATLNGITGSTLTAGTTISAQLTSTEVGGALGGKGTYTVSASQTLTSQVLNAETLHTKISFAGVPGTTILKPGVVGYQSDWIECDIPPGGVGRLRHFASVAATGQMPRGFNFNSTIFPGAQASSISGTTETDQTTNLSYAWGASTSYNALFCANRIVGTSKTRTLSMGFEGDSVTYGTGYNNNLGLGWLGQFFNGSFNTANHGFPGERGYFAVSPSMNGFKVRQRLARLCDVINWAWASNDFHYMTGTEAAKFAQMQGTAFAMWLQYLKRGVKISAATCTPQSSSTDSWISDANQTPLTSWADGGGVQLWNAWLRDGAPLSGSLAAGAFTAQPTGTPSSNTVFRIGDAAHPVFMLLDIAFYCESPTKIGVWRSDGGVQWTPDGVHPLDNAVQAFRTAQQATAIATLKAIEATLV